MYGRKYLTAPTVVVAMITACLLVALATWAAFPTQAACDTPSSIDGPRLMRVAPSGGGVVGRDTVVALSFDRPMDLESLRSAVSFSPIVAFDVSGEAECLIVPVNLLEGGREYSFRLEAGRARDMRGRAYEGEVTLAFSARDDGMILEVPAFSCSNVIFEGENPQGVVSNIGFGAGHYPGTGRPGGGNLVLMAHASGQVPFLFNRMHELAAGDEIRIKYGGRTYAYRWREGVVVPDTAMWIVDPRPYPQLTFFVCCAADGNPSPSFHPPYRYVVRAILSSSVP